MGETHTQSYPLIFAALCVGTGLAFSHIYSYLPYTVSAVLLGVGLPALWIGRAGRGPIFGFLLLLCALGYGQYNQWHLPNDHIAHLEEGKWQLTATVTELPHTERGVSRFFAEALSVRRSGETTGHPVSGRVKISHYLHDGESPLGYGDTFLAPVTLRRITSLNNPGGFDYAAHMARKKIWMRASIRRADTPEMITRAHGPTAALQRWRGAMATAIKEALPADQAAFLVALSIGDTRGLSEPLRETFQAAGMAHVLAISGTHLGLVTGVVFALVRLLLKGLPWRLFRAITRRVTPATVAGIVALLAVSGYAALSGGRVPTLRALLMVWLVTIALLAGRKSHTPTALAAAALLILALDPAALGSASFQLSFCAVLGIVLALYALPPGPDQPTWRWKLKLAALTTVLVTLAAGAATAPLVAYHFGQVSWPGFLANLLLVPALGLTVLPLGLAAAVLSPLVGHLPWEPILSPLLANYLAASGWFAGLPNALSHVAPPPFPLVLGSYGAVLIAILGRRHLAPGAWALGGVVLMSTWGVALHPSPPTGTLRITFLDVGQGDAAVLTGPGGDALVIDSGTRFGRFDVGRLALAPYLRRQGIRTVSLMASHPQLDHAGGFIYLLPRFDVTAFYDNGDRTAARFDRTLQQALTAAGVSPTPLRAGDHFTPLAGVDTRVLYPNTPGKAVKRADNDRSLVLSVGYGRHRFLFTGDIEHGAEAALLAGRVNLAATVLKVPHHGSKSSSGEAFLDRVAPRLAVFSAGRHNPYGHPHPSVWQRYLSRDIRPHLTAGQGALLLESDGATLRMAAWDTLRLHAIPPGADRSWAVEKKNLLRLLAPRRLWETVPDGTGSPT